MIFLGLLRNQERCYAIFENFKVESSAVLFEVEVGKRFNLALTGNIEAVFAVR